MKKLILLMLVFLAFNSVLATDIEYKEIYIFDDFQAVDQLVNYSAPQGDILIESCGASCVSGSTHHVHDQTNYNYMSYLNLNKSMTNVVNISMYVDAYTSDTQIIHFGDADTLVTASPYLCGLQFSNVNNEWRPRPAAAVEIISGRYGWVDFILNFNNDTCSIIGENNTYNVAFNDPTINGVSRVGFSGFNGLYVDNITFSESTFDILVYVNILDENTLNAITDNITLYVSNNNTQEYYWTTTAYDEVGGYINESFTISAGSGDYPFRHYDLFYTVGGDKYLNVFLSQNASNYVTFTFRDSFSSDQLEDVTLTVERVINNTWTTIYSKKSDITGRAQFNYIEDTRYRFTAIKSGYDSKQWILDPVLFSSYTVKLDKTTTAYYEEDLQGLYLLIEPKTFYDEQLNNLSITLYSDTEALTEYDVLVSYPGGTNTSSGSNSIGETFDFKLPITGAGTYDTVLIRINYSTDNTARNVSYLFEIMGQTPGNNTIMQNKTEDYGMGLFERVLVAVLVIIALSGLAASFAGEFGAGVVMLLSLGVAVYIGFIPIWAALSSLLVGFVLIASRSSE